MVIFLLLLFDPLWLMWQAYNVFVFAISQGISKMLIKYVWPFIKLTLTHLLNGTPNMF